MRNPNTLGQVPEPISTARRDASAIARLGAPLLVNNVAAVGMTFTDTVMAGQLGARDLAAVAVGASYFSFFYLGAIGFFMALSPLVSHAFGAARAASIASYLRQALWLGLLLSSLTITGLAFAEPLLLGIGIEPGVARLAARYCWGLAAGVPAAFAYLALRFTSEGIGWTRPIMLCALLGLGANVLGNYALMFGHWGAPALGAVGAAVATSIVHWLMLASLFMYMRSHAIYANFKLFAQFEWPQLSRIREVLHLAVPICGSVLAEGALFAAAGLMMGTLGAAPMAAHAIAINYAALMFMVPLSLHSATTIHVGQALGRGEFAAGRYAGWVGIALCVATMSVSAVVLVFARQHIAALYTNDAVVMAFAAHLLVFAAVFQVADGLQVGAAGALRGFKDARMPLLLNIVSYWMIAFPLAYYLGIVRGHGADAVWTGLILGLFVCAVLLTLRYYLITRQPSAERISS